MSNPGGFVSQVAELVTTAARIYAGTPERAGVEEVAARLHGPLRVAIAGKVKAGKSTLLNALVGEELAPTDAGECTRVPWWFRDGLTYRVTLRPQVGAPQPARFARADGALDVDLGDLAADDLESIDVEWPSRALRTLTLIDTPGIASATPALTKAAERFFSLDDERAGPADAVIYLMRHLHADDVGFLESFNGDIYAGTTPVNTIAVLSRADELGVGRLDAMESAARVAGRYRQDRRLARLCQTVVPVAGLLAQASVTMREDEYRLLSGLAQLPEPELEELLLSVDRFATRPGPAPPADRVALMRRFGVFGTRLAVHLLGSERGADASTLKAALLAISGVEGLRSLLAQQFAARSDLLKGRAALLALGDLVRRAPAPGSDALEAALERVHAGAHELVEMRFLNALRSGEVALPAGQADEAARLLGGDGPDPRSRLGLDLTAGDAELATALTEALGRWQRRAESPLALGPAAEAARAVVRACEAVAAGLPRAGAAGPGASGDPPGSVE